LPLETAFIAGGWSEALNPATIQDVMGATSFGHAWELEAAAARILIATLTVLAMRLMIIAEIIFGIGVVGLVSVFKMLDPI